MKMVMSNVIREPLKNERETKVRTAFHRSTRKIPFRFRRKVGFLKLMLNIEENCSHHSHEKQDHTLGKKKSFCAKESNSGRQEKEQSHICCANAFS